MDNNTNWINLAYLILIAAIVIWFAVTHTKNFHLWQQEKQNIEEKMELLNKTNMLLTEENIQLKEQIALYNNANFNLLSSIVEQYSKLKDENIALKKENDKAKKDLTTATSNEKHIMMKIE